MSQLSILIIGGAGKTDSRVNTLLSQVMPGVEEALGRPAHHFSDDVRAAAATGLWRA
jgi:hypothetical protein